MSKNPLPTLAQARELRARLERTGQAANPLSETETVGDRVDQYIVELEDHVGMTRSGLRYIPPIQPAPTWADKPFGTWFIVSIWVAILVCTLLYFLGALFVGQA